MKTKSFSHFIQGYFLSYMIAQRGYGKNTLASYRDTFKLLFLFLEENKRAVSTLPIDKVDKSCIVDFLHWLESTRNNTVSTRNVRLAHLKSFWGYVLATTPEWANHCSQIIHIPFKKTEREPPAYLTETETKQLLGMPDGKTRSGIRHMAILALLYDSGCRVQELITLNTSDVTLGDICKLFIKGKGDKYREVPIMPETGKVLSKYIRIHARPSGPPLFINSRRERLTRAGISHILKKYQNLVVKMNKRPFQEKLSPHLLRHSKATHLVNQGVSIYNIRDFLGDASVTTTQMYLTSNPEVMREAVERASLKTAPDSADYFSSEEKKDLMAFLETLF